jgi:hypothetical protein
VVGGPPGHNLAAIVSARYILPSFREPYVRIQRRFLSLVAGLVAIAVISACGSSSTSSSAVSGKTSAQIVAQALSKAQGQEFNFTSLTSLSADTSKVTGFTASQLGNFGPILANGLTVKIDGTYESPTRTMVHVTVTAPVCSGQIYAVDYDGRSYASTDGATWADAGPSSSSSSSSTINQSQLANNLTGVGFNDKGSTSQDQQTVEDIRLDLNNQIIQKIATAAGQTSTAAGVSQFVTVNGNGVDIFVRPSDGLPESVKGTLNVTLDVASVVQLISLAGSSSPLGDLSSAGGKLGVSVGEDTQFTNWGNATVTKPSVTAGTTVTSFCPELSGLAALGGSTGGGSTTVPTP